MATASITHWVYKPNKAGKYPVKIAVQHQKERRYYALRLPGDGTNLHLSTSEFEKATEKSKLGKLMEAELVRAKESMPNPFTWLKFETKFNDNGTSFFKHFDNYIKRLLKENRPGTALAYKSALTKWKDVSDDFQPSEVLGQLHILGDAVSRPSTRGFYLRATKAVYNRIRKDFPDLPAWNFQISSKVSTHKGTTVPIETLRAFINAKQISAAQEYARNVFMLSFWAGGMNVADILRLKWSDIKEDRISFVREKTKRTAEGVSTEIPVTTELREVLNTFKHRGSVYVIHDFDRSGTPMELLLRTKGYLKNVNRRMRLLCKANGIEPFTTYSARHSFASLLKFNGVANAKISELLGHQSMATTEAYLRRFDIESKAEAVNTIKLKVA